MSPVAKRGATQCGPGCCGFIKPMSSGWSHCHLSVFICGKDCPCPVLSCKQGSWGSLILSYLRSMMKSTIELTGTPPLGTPVSNRPLWPGSNYGIVMTSPQLLPECWEWSRLLQKWQASLWVTVQRMTAGRARETACPWSHSRLLENVCLLEWSHLDWGQS